MLEVISSLRKNLRYICNSSEDFIRSPEKIVSELKSLELLTPTIISELDKVIDKNISIEEKKLVLNSLQIELNLLFLSLEESQQPVHKLKKDIGEIKGVGNRISEALEQFGIATVEDIIFHFPFRYEYLSEDGIGSKTLFKGKYVDKQIINGRYGKKIFIGFFESIDLKNKQLLGVWMNNAVSYIRGYFKEGQEYNLYGTISKYKSAPAIFHPEILNSLENDIVRPVYSLPNTVKSKSFNKFVNEALNHNISNIKETLPLNLLDKNRLPAIKDAINTLHDPKTKNNCISIMERKHPAITRFIYEELFYQQLIFKLKKNRSKQIFGMKNIVDKEMLYRIKEYMPFTLTKAQRKVMSEILNDMMSHYPMNRLLEGDVGSGKTIISFIAGLINIYNGHQVAIIAPTEVLAEQHFKGLEKFLKNSEYKIGFLSGSSKAKDKVEIKKLIEAGEINFIIGTHALLEENVVFKSLGLAIIDEQHRFGVEQRKKLSDKGYNPDLLLMSATPIPRTLAMTLYGDLDISIIDEMPPGRIPITTKAYSQSSSEHAQNTIQQELNAGHKIYVVYPLIEESEKIDIKSAMEGYEQYLSIYSQYGVGLLHGKMKATEKQRLFDDFRTGKIKILVATTVIEVGVDVPDATVMVVENAERFGLSQLHQLRGRVGRSDKPSYCILLHSPALSENGKKRIDAMVRYSSGFKLSNIDLEIRGAGDFFGVNQSGLPSMLFADILLDQVVLQLARKDVYSTLEQDPNLSKPQNSCIHLALNTRWKKFTEFFNTG